MATRSLDWAVGFAWGIGTINRKQFYISYNDEVVLNELAETIGKIYSRKTTKNVLWINLANILPQTLFSLGWTGRTDKFRKYPQGDIDELEFTRGYCYTKADLGICASRNRRKELVRRLRLRIYGNKNIVENIDLFLQRTLKTTPKKVYHVRVKKPDGQYTECFQIGYESKKEVLQIAELLQIKNREIIKNRLIGNNQADGIVRRRENETRTYEMG